MILARSDWSRIASFVLHPARGVKSAISVTFHENEHQLGEASRTMEENWFRNLKDVSRFGIDHLKESFEDIYCLMTSHLNGNAKVNKQNMQNKLK